MADKNQTMPSDEDEAPPRDISDEEMASMTKQEKIRIVSKTLKLKFNQFHANYMLMNAAYTPSDLRELEARDPSSAAYFVELTTKCA